MGDEAAQLLCTHARTVGIITERYDDRNHPQHSRQIRTLARTITSRLRAIIAHAVGTDQGLPDVYYSIHRVPANTNGESYQSTYTVQVRRAYSSLRYSRHRPIRFDSDRVDVIRGDVKRDRQRARDQHEWAPWRYTDGPSTRAFEGPFEAVGLAGAA